MADTILYGYSSNFAALDALKSVCNDAETLREDVQQVFQALTGVYQGQAADALQQVHMQISGQMDQVILDIQALLQQAVERQYITAQQDQQLAAGLG
jgi:ATP-dependent Clp protease adapter protein ClpS